MAKYWYVKIVVLVMALVGIIWMMQSLKSGAYYRNPNSPVQLLLGGEHPAPVVAPTPPPPVESHSAPPDSPQK